MRLPQNTIDLNGNIRSNAVKFSSYINYLIRSSIHKFRYRLQMAHSQTTLLLGKTDHMKVEGNVTVDMVIYLDASNAKRQSTVVRYYGE